MGNNSSVTSSFGVVLGSGATAGIGLIAAAQLGIPVQLAGPGPVGVPAGIVKVNIDGVIYLVQLYEPP